MDTAEFTEGARKADGILSGLSAKFGITAKNAAIAGAAIGAAFAAAAAAMGYAIKRAIDDADRLDELSQSLGVSVESLSALRYAAELSGVSIESFSTAIKMLSVNIARFASGDTTTASARVFTALGISVLDASGKIKSADAIMLEIAAKFALYADGATKTAAAMALFGKAGAAMIPFLNAGRDGIKQLTDEAAKLGIVISGQTAAAAGKFNDTLHSLSVIFGATALKLMESLLPALQAFADYLKSASSETGILSAAISAGVIAFKALSSALIIINANYQIFMDTLYRVYLTMTNLVSLDFTAAWASLSAIPTEAINAANVAMTALNNTWSQTQAIATATADVVNKPQMPASQSTKDLSAAVSAHNTVLADAKRLTEEYLTPLELLSKKQREIQTLFEKGAITAVTYGRAMAQASAFSAKNMDALASSVSSNLSAIFGETKAVAIATALINTYQGITKALAEYPPPISFAMAALQAAAGFAQVANIQSQTKSGGAGGRSAGGGVSGGAASAQAAEVAGGRSNTLTVQGISPGQLFSGDVVRAFAGELLQFQRDGGRVILA
jgi:hypothetical protein